MLANYLKLSLRLLARNPFFTFINVAGLSVGFAVFFILWPFTQAELKTDQFMADYERIARSILDFRWTDNGGESWGHLNIPFGASHIASEMRNHNSVEDVTRYIPQPWFGGIGTPELKGEIIFTVEQAGQSSSTKLENSICADPNFFEFFGLPFIHGNRATALQTAEAITLSQRISSSFFGTENPVGRLLKVNGKPYHVTGVFENLPYNSHLQFDVVFSNMANSAAWDQIDEHLAYQYFKVKGDPSQLPAILNENKERLLGAYLKKNQHIKIDFITQPLTEIAFSHVDGGGYGGDIIKSKSKFMLKILAGVSIAVLMMAWMNYVNLTVSQTKTRFKEIATRKVSGALLPDLFIQFICHSAVINVLAALIGLTIIQLVRLPFDQFLNIRIVSFKDLEVQTILIFLITFVVGIIATAAYPAWATMKYSTRQLLTKNVTTRKRLVTTILTTAQYVTALSLIAWVFVMNSQLTFILDKDLGIDRENIIVIESPVIGLEENGNQKMVSFADMIKSKLNVADVALSASVCGGLIWNINVKKVGSQVFYGFDSHGGVDENFIPTYKLKLIAGRNFLKNEPKLGIILSRFASQRLGFKSPEDAVGAMIEYKFASEWETLEVIGIIEDYRMSPYLSQEGSTESVTGRGQGLTYMNSAWAPYVPNRLSLKLSATEIHSLSEVEKLFNKLFPGNIFRWYFLDDNIRRQYGDQKIARNQVMFFTVLAVAVACLGLLGMISNKVVEKIKEISVRRILGAQNHHILSLLLSSTGVQIGIALVVGLPIAWEFSQQYLEKYTDHVALQWWHFALPTLILLGIMFATISSVLWKAARCNPVDALKYE